MTRGQSINPSKQVIDSCAYLGDGIEKCGRHGRGLLIVDQITTRMVTQLLVPLM